jgi:hypothetical protein
MDQVFGIATAKRVHVANINTVEAWLHTGVNVIEVGTSPPADRFAYVAKRVPTGLAGDTSGSVIAPKQLIVTVGAEPAAEFVRLLPYISVANVPPLDVYAPATKRKVYRRRPNCEANPD